MSKIESEKDIITLKSAGKRLAEIVEELKEKVIPGIKTKELDRVAEELIRREGDEPSFLNYSPSGGKNFFPASLCVSVNNEVVHGIPGDRAIINGDLVGLDLGLSRNGIYVDMAVTVGVGNVSGEEKKLIEVTNKALFKGIDSATAGNRIGAISNAIEEHANKYGYGIVRDLGGHGLGYSVHDKPFIPNFGSPDSGIVLEVGMVIALEPMFTLGSGEVGVLNDGFTVVTKDDTKSAHFEHSILITKDHPLILTK